MPTDVTVRGFYDLSGMRADADLMVWWHAPTAEALQAAARSLRRTAVGRSLQPVLVGDGPAPAGRVQQGARPGVPGRCAAEAVGDRLPVRPVLRVVPAAGARSAAACSSSTG